MSTFSVTAINSIKPVCVLQGAQRVVRMSGLVYTKYIHNMYNIARSVIIN